jgi:hypothetical protein
LRVVIGLDEALGGDRGAAHALDDGGEEAVAAQLGAVLRRGGGVDLLAARVEAAKKGGEIPYQAAADVALLARPELAELAGVLALAVFLPAAWLVHGEHRGLVALWLAYSLWLLARFVTLVLRARGSRWLVTGAVRR